MTHDSEQNIPSKTPISKKNTSKKHVVEDQRELIGLTIPQVLGLVEEMESQWHDAAPAVRRGLVGDYSKLVLLLLKLLAEQRKLAGLGKEKRQDIEKLNEDDLEWMERFLKKNYAKNPSLPHRSEDPA